MASEVEPAPTLIPLAMRLESDRWAVWQSTPHPDGPPRKVPHSVVTGGLAGSNRPEQWTTYPRAVAYLHSHPDASGLAFRLGDGYAGVDFDACRDPDTGLFADAAWEEIKRLDSYTEISPSGTGAKVFMRATLPEGVSVSDGIRLALKSLSR